MFLGDKDSFGLGVAGHKHTVPKAAILALLQSSAPMQEPIASL